MARLVNIKVSGVSVGGPASRCSNCGSAISLGLLCEACEGKAEKAAGILAESYGARFAFTRKNDRWELRVGAAAPWIAAHQFACAIAAVRDIAASASEFGERVVRAAKVGRTDSTSQKEHDRLQDTVSKAIEALGVELKYA